MCNVHPFIALKMCNCALQLEYLQIPAPEGVSPQLFQLNFVVYLYLLQSFPRFFEMNFDCVIKI